MKGAFVQLGFNVAVIVNLLLYFGVLHLVFPVLLTSLAIVYTAVFAGLCYTSRLLTTSIAFAPFIATKLQLKFMSVLASYAARGFKPVFPEWTLSYELSMAMLRFVLVEFGQAIVHENASQLRDATKLWGETNLASSCRKHNTNPEKLVANGMEHTWLRDPEKKERRVVVIHYHGGGYCLSHPLQHVELANRTHTNIKQALKKQYQLDVSVDVLLANYRKAPEFLYPSALNDCFDMHKYVLEHENVAPDHVVLSGDSAGAEMSLTNCMRLREEDPTLQPAAALCYSPLVDFSEEGSDDSAPYCSLVSNFLDHCLPLYLRDVTDPEQRRLASPINHSLRDLPPVFLQWGSLERFYHQGLRFKAKALAQGVTSMEVDILHNMAHDAVMLPSAVMPSAAEKGIENGCAFAAKNLAAVLCPAATRIDPETEP
jgi:acetyl esterase/lipase